MTSWPLVVRQAAPAKMLHDLGDAVGDYFAGATPEQLEWITVNGLTGAHLPNFLPGLFDSVRPHMAPYVPEPAIGLNHVLFRDIPANPNPDGSHYFHQDHDLIPTLFPFNMWLPLTKIDAECLGLSFVLPHPTEVYPLPFDLDGYLSKGGHVWTPELEVGDLVIFNNMAMHGGYRCRPTSNGRRSVEFRFGPKAGLADYAHEVYCP